MRKHGPGGLRGPRRTLALWLRDDRAAVEGSIRALSRHSRADRPIRHDLVARVRSEIAAGDYLTEERWQAALDRLFEELE